MSNSFFVLLSLKDVLVISHVTSVNEMMCPWGVSAWSQVKSGGPINEDIYNIRLYSIIKYGAL